MLDTKLTLGQPGNLAHQLPALHSLRGHPVTKPIISADSHITEPPVMPALQRDLAFTRVDTPVGGALSSAPGVFVPA